MVRALRDEGDLFGRLVPIVRTFVWLPAGIERMSMPLFVGYTALGSLAWNATLLFTGYQAGDNWQTDEQYAIVFTARAWCSRSC
ncbi:hypothetical protein [Streptomyces sp. MP131-18]|uniref:DedA family protein n=1 Tax=Streptomyces sp. MP131-18 TaxID=1857892 RepID=UPI00097BA960|nr:hypothetical protein [Streptomyces sp. MP131-18]ONK10499.1 SNARE associated Golgi protein [Streptomyces sp. MP131-18]